MVNNKAKQQPEQKEDEVYSIQVIFTGLVGKAGA